jgi:hypothetical protein
MTNYHAQDLHSNTPPARDKADAWRSALMEAFEGGAGEGDKSLIAQGFVSLLGEVGSQMVAGGVIGFILPLLRRLFDQSDAIARRSNLILDEPFLTAARALRDIASVEIRSLDELRGWQRQLAVAFDSFARFYHQVMASGGRCEGCAKSQLLRPRCDKRFCVDTERVARHERWGVQQRRVRSQATG